MALNISKKTSPADIDSSAKGDIPVNSGTNIVSLTVGTDGQILEADSSETTGLKWSDKPLSTTAKGELITYTTKPSLLSAGSDGQVLTVASSTAEGIEWKELGGLNLTETKYVTTSTIDRFYTSGSIQGQNGIFNYIGTQAETVAYSNPILSDEINIFLNGTEITGGELLDKNYSSTAFNFGPSSNILIDLKRDSFFLPTHLGINANVNSQGRQLLIEASNDAVVWDTLADVGHATSDGAIELTSSNFYRYIRLTDTGSAGNPHSYREIELYGSITPLTPTYNIVDADNNKILLVPFGNATQVNIPTGLGSNGFTCQITGTVGAAHPITINPLPGVTFIGQNFTIDNVGEVATIYQVSTNTYVVSISRGKLPLTSKGDILTHDGNEPVVQVIGSDNTVLAADSNEASGVAWKNVTSIAGSPFTTQRLDLSATLQLTASSARYLYLSAVDQTRDVVLTSPPSTNDFFYIVNRDGNNPIQIKETVAGGVIQTLNSNTPVAQCHYDGTEWQVISQGNI